MLYLKLGTLISEVNDRTTINNQYDVLTSSQDGIISQSEYFNKQVASVDNIGYKIIKEGQFTYRSMSDTGKFYINKLNNITVGIVSPAYPVFEIISNKLISGYLELFFKSNYFQNQISNKSIGSTRLALKYNRLSKLDICVPEIEVQKEIVNNIFLIKKQIQIKSDELYNYDELIKSRFNEMFGDEINTVTVADSCEIHARIGWQALTQKEHMKKGDYMLITGTDFLDNEIDYSNCVYVTKERYEMDHHIILKNDDVLITKDGTIGKVAIVHNLPKPATLNSGIFVVRPDDRFLKEYISYVFKGDLFTKFVDEVKTGATIKHLNQASLLKFKIPVPSKERQMKFASFAKQIDKLKFTKKEQLLHCPS